MFLDEFKRYNAQYEQGIKKISFKESWVKIEGKTFDLQIRQGRHNYDLFFTTQGVLFTIVNKDKHSSSKTYFGYDGKNRLISAMTLCINTNRLKEISEFIYDEQGRIETETCRIFDFTEISKDLKEEGVEYRTEFANERLHNYYENKEEIKETNEWEEESDYITYLTYDTKKRVIEEKMIRNEVEILFWYKYEYNEAGDLISSIDLDKNNEEINNTKNSSGFDKDAFLYNENGHWIKQTIVHNEHIRVFDRVIEYYKNEK